MPKKEPKQAGLRALTEQVFEAAGVSKSDFGEVTVSEGWARAAKIPVADVSSLPIEEYLKKIDADSGVYSAYEANQLIKLFGSIESALDERKISLEQDRVEFENLEHDMSQRISGELPRTQGHPGLSEDEIEDDIELFDPAALMCWVDQPSRSPSDDVRAQYGLDQLRLRQLLKEKAKLDNRASQRVSDAEMKDIENRIREKEKLINASEEYRSSQSPLKIHEVRRLEINTAIENHKVLLSLIEGAEKSAQRILTKREKERENPVNSEIIEVLTTYFLNKNVFRGHSESVKPSLTDMRSHILSSKIKSVDNDQFKNGTLQAILKKFPDRIVQLSKTEYDLADEIDEKLRGILADVKLPISLVDLFKRLESSGVRLPTNLRKDGAEQDLVWLVKIICMLRLQPAKGETSGKRFTIRFDGDAQEPFIYSKYDQQKT